MTLPTPLSQTPETLGDRYGVLVVGSGYGGAVTAARLAQQGHSVAVLERGKEWQVGTFPDHADALFAEMRSDQQVLGLYDYQLQGDANVLVGNGLGGGSLINANVVLGPAPAVFDSPRWPRVIREEAKSGVLEGYYERVRATLSPAPVPADRVPRKAKAHLHAAEKVGKPVKLLDLAVHFGEPGPNVAGVTMQPCTHCGDCITGCNVGAKGTLAMNYLPLAKAAGAELFTQVEVDFLLPCEAGGYWVFVRFLPQDEAPTISRVLHAETVILAAGVLGSTGILMRSRDRGLKLSHRLGYQFSVNGDMLGFGYNTDTQTNLAGFGTREPPEPGFEVGPGIVCAADYRSPKQTGALDFIIEDGAIPRALGSTFRRLAPLVAAAGGVDTDEGILDKAQEIGRILRDQVSESPKGAINHTAIFLAMGHDGADGRLILDERDRPRIVWGALADRLVFEGIHREMRGLTKQLGGTYVDAPKWSDYLGEVPMTVHPLGGCAMAEDERGGVVDSEGRVFRIGATPHEGLYVADGAIVPTSLGVNPFFTISALAERVAEKLDARTFVDGVRRPIVPRATPLPVPPSPVAPEGLGFTESLRGWLTKDVTNARTPEQFFEAERRGAAQKSLCEVRLSMLVDDVDRFIGTPSHAAEAVGHVDSRLFGRKRPVDRGLFNLFIADEKTGEKRMIYELVFFAEDKQKYLLAGFKVLRDDDGFDLLSDTTTLFTTLHRGGSKDGPVVAQGVLRIHPGEVVALAASLSPRHVSGPVEGAAVLAKFGRFFFGELWDSYFSVHHPLAKKGE